MLRVCPNCWASISLGPKRERRGQGWATKSSFRKRHTSLRGWRTSTSYPPPANSSSQISLAHKALLGQPESEAIDHDKKHISSIKSDF